MTFRSPLGTSDFRALREQNLSFIDKSNFISEFLDSTQQVLLLPRPRRFGKTLNLSMLRSFLEHNQPPLHHFFEDLHVFRCPNASLYRQHFQQHPVVFITFKDLKAGNLELAQSAIHELIRNLFIDHKAVLDSPALDPSEQRDFHSILDRTASPARYRHALADLTKYIHKAYAKKPIVLIDEYDTPIHSAWVKGFAPDILEFFRTFLTAGLKDNPHLYRAVLTGILRIARESIFSGLINLAVYTLLDRPFSTCFGFNENDIHALLNLAGHPEYFGVVQAWYNGYLFYDQVTYNPWSVLSFLTNEGEAQPYWINTSSNDLIKHVLQSRAASVGPIIEDLLEGGSFETILDKNTVLDDLETKDDALWSLLTFSGYLKAERRSRGPGEQSAHALRIPNAEVRLIYKQSFVQWMQRGFSARGAGLQKLLSALFQGDSELLQDQLQALVLNVLSYHDAGPTEPEAIYQAFVLGLLCILEPEYRVRSNRESGKGRPDVMILPKQPGKPGILLELKAVYRGTLEQALDKAAQQIQTQGYASELKASGADPIHAFAIAFDGKEIRVLGVPAS